MGTKQINAISKGVTEDIFPEVILDELKEESSHTREEPKSASIMLAPETNTKLPESDERIQEQCRHLKYEVQDPKEEKKSSTHSAEVQLLVPPINISSLRVRKLEATHLAVGVSWMGSK
ncbi:hypothetical protein JTB14_037234 [Gonioctena quinquepunctata]|nr:hypothetical protein JTB14_037234 [Gonioctena quinquepunctata]